MRNIQERSLKFLYFILESILNFLELGSVNVCIPSSPCGQISWRWPAPDQTVWFPVLALTIRPGLGRARTVRQTFCCFEHKHVWS